MAAMNTWAMRKPQPCKEGEGPGRGGCTYMWQGSVFGTKCVCISCMVSSDFGAFGYNYSIYDVEYMGVSSVVLSVHSYLGGGRFEPLQNLRYVCM